MHLNTDFTQLVTNDVISRAKTGDHSAFKDIYNAYSAIAFTVAIRIVKQQELAQDVVQEAFIKVFRHISTYEGDVVFMAWFKRIVINEAINKLKAQNKFVSDIEEYDDNNNESLFNENWLNAQQDLQSLLAQLSVEYRAVFVLHEVEGYKHKDIAVLLGKSESYSKVTLMRCYKKLRELALK